MADHVLEIGIEANVQGAVKGVDAVTASLNKVQPAAAKAGAGLQVVGRGAANATPALINFGRVIQDAPFGLIGVANNIDPLISSFTALKASTGSTGAAFKALLGSLAGPAGIGIAVSAVTSALIAFGPALFGASKEAKKLDEAIGGAAKNAADELVKLQSYASFATDVTKSYDERKKAVDALQKEYPQYLKNISDEAILTGQATEAINASIDAILRKATLSLLKDEIATVVAESAKQILEIEKGKIATEQAFRAEQQRKEGLKTQTDEFNKNAAAQLASGRASGDIAKGLDKIGLSADRAFANRPEEKLKQIRADLQQMIQPLIDASVNFEDLGNAAAGAATKGLAPAKTALDKFLESFRTGLATGLQQGVATDTKFIIDAEIQFSKEKSAENLKKTIDALRTVFSVANNGVVIPVSLGKIGMDTDIQAIVDSVKNGMDAAAAELQKRSQEFTALVRNMAESVASAIGEGIGNALSGQSNPFAALINVLGAGLKSLGQMYIKIGVEMLIAQKALKAIANNPYLTIAAGIALQALGTILQNQARSQTKLAEGGVVSGPTSALIGEAGQSEVVMPLSRLSGMLRNNGGMGKVVFEIEGQKLVGVLSRATSSHNRTFG